MNPLLTADVESIPAWGVDGTKPANKNNSLAVSRSTHALLSRNIFAQLRCLQLLKSTRQTRVVRKAIQIEELDSCLGGAVLGLAFTTCPSIVPSPSQLLTKSLTFLLSILLAQFQLQLNSCSCPHRSSAARRNSTTHL